MSDRYGPQTVEVEALLDRIRTLTEKEAGAFRVARNAVGYAALQAEWAARDSAWAARAACSVPRWPAVPFTVWDAIRDALLALSVRHLIGQHGFTQEHFDTLVGPWESVVGTEWTREATVRDASACGGMSPCPSWA